MANRLSETKRRSAKNRKLGALPLDRRRDVPTCDTIEPDIVHTRTGNEIAGRLAALHWFGQEHYVAVPEALAEQAQQFALVLASVGWFKTAPPDSVEMAARLVQAALKAQGGPNRKAWHTALDHALQILPTLGVRRADGTRNRDRSGEAAVRAILERVVGMAPDSPDAFKKPTPERIARAVRVIDGHFITRAPKELATAWRLRADGRRVVSSWKAAVLFADAFDEYVPEKRDADRPVRTSKGRTPA